MFNAVPLLRKGEMASVVEGKPPRLDLDLYPYLTRGLVCVENMLPRLKEYPRVCGDNLQQVPPLWPAPGIPR